MKIQSLSVVVPAERCINRCKFCVAQMVKEPYKNQLDLNLTFFDLYQRDYLKRMEFARDNGCNTVMLTGNAEPQQNRPFLEKFGTLNQQLSKPFRWIEMQTTGTLLDDGYLRFLRNHVGVSTISISLCSFDSGANAEICGMKKPVDLEHLCAEIKRYDFNLRLSINLTNAFEQITPEGLFRHCGETLQADQVTFRVLYQSQGETAQDRWISQNGLSKACLTEIQSYIESHGEPLEHLEYGALKYAVHGMSTVLDEDCMSKSQGKEEYKYLILRPNCKLYSKWDDPASLIF